MLALVAIITSFLVGFAMKYGGLCTYAAALQIVREQRSERLMAFLGAASWTALVVIPLAWIWPEGLQLSASHDRWAMVLSGGALLGLGAYLNRGCVFGTFVQLTGGNLNYLATLVGMVSGAVGAKYWLADIAPVRTDPALAAVPGIWAGIWLLVAALVLIAVCVDFSAPAATRRIRLRPIPGILVGVTLGIGGGWLFAAVNGWDFATVMMRAAWHELELTPSGPAALTVYCTLSMVAGGVVAAVSQKRFSWQAPELMQSLGNFAGGALMGMAAIILPGGNDGLLLSGIPALAPYALLGFGLMLVTMMLLLALTPNDKGFRIGGRY